MRKQIKIWVISICIGICFFPARGWAWDPGTYQTVQLFFENDLFGKTDKYYTNAVQLTWISRDLATYADDIRLPSWSIPVIQKVPFVNEKDGRHNVGLIVGQQIYTPENIRTSEFIAGDRPYAGFLYVGVALHSKTKHKLDTIEAVLGIVGPSSLAREAQNGVHKLRDIDEALGWGHQLENEPGLRVSWQRKWRSWRWDTSDHMGADLITYTGVTLGNVRISSNIGAEVRFGFQIPLDFGSDVIRSGAGVSAPLIDTQSSGTNRLWGFHAFTGAQVEGVARDIFLDGNTWKASHSVEKKHLVADLSAGIAFNYDTWKVTYRHLFRTCRFENQSRGQTIGSITMTWSF